MRSPKREVATNRKADVRSAKSEVASDGLPDANFEATELPEYRTSNIGLRTSDSEHRTSNIGLFLCYLYST